MSVLNQRGQIAAKKYLLIVSDSNVYDSVGVAQVRCVGRTAHVNWATVKPRHKAFSSQDCMLLTAEVGNEREKKIQFYSVLAYDGCTRKYPTFFLRKQVTRGWCAQAGKCRAQ